jgi:hypothetical protein
MADPNDRIRGARETAGNPLFVPALVGVAGAIAGLLIVLAGRGAGGTASGLPAGPVPVSQPARAEATEASRPPAAPVPASPQPGASLSAKEQQQRIWEAQIRNNRIAEREARWAEDHASKQEAGNAWRERWRQRWHERQRGKQRQAAAASASPPQRPTVIPSDPPGATPPSVTVAPTVTVPEFGGYQPPAPQRDSGASSVPSGAPAGGYGVDAVPTYPGAGPVSGSGFGGGYGYGSGSGRSSGSYGGARTERVRSYFRKDGTYVQGYNRRRRR